MRRFYTTYLHVIENQKVILIMPPDLALLSTLKQTREKEDLTRVVISYEIYETSFRRVS